MRAALLVGTGGPKMLEVRADVPVPQLDQGYVLVRVSACGVNNTDINTRVGWYSRSVTGATSTVNAVVGGVYPLEQIRVAQKVFEAKKHVGSIVITI